MRSAWSAFRTLRTKSRSRICSTPLFDKYRQEVPWATTTSSLPRAFCAICWKARAILRATFKSSASPAQRAFYCATGRGLPLSRPHRTHREARRAPARHYLVAGLCGALGGLEPGGRVGERRQPGSPRRRAAAGHRRGRGGPPRLHAVGAQRALPPRDPLPLASMFATWASSTTTGV